MHLALPIVPLESSLGSCSRVFQQLLRSAHLVLFPRRLGKVHGSHIQLALASDALLTFRLDKALGPAPLPGSRGEANRQRGEILLTLSIQEALMVLILISKEYHLPNEQVSPILWLICQIKCMQLFQSLK
jgi:hypothetical protein